VSKTDLVLTIFALQQSLFALLWAVAAYAGMSRRAAQHWSPAMVVVSVGMILIVQRAQLPMWASWWLANTCLVAGLVLLRRGIEHFADAPPADLEHALAVTGVAVGVGLATLTESVWSAVFVASLLTGAVMLRLAHFVVRNLAARSGRLVSLVCAAPLALVGALLVARASLAWAQPERFGQALNAATDLNIGVTASMLTAGMLVNFSLAGLVVARMVGELRHYSDHDPLTGLLNRRGIEHRLRAEHQRLARHGHRYALLSLDLDHFKRINDEHGHPVGDAVLRAFGEVLRRAGRGADGAARVGGEEFWVLLPDTGLDGAMPLAERILHEVRNLSLPEAPVRVTVSIGIAATAVRTEPAEALMRRLDAALYLAKAGGRDRVVCAGALSVVDPGGALRHRVA
jgi:diguanylate cyclase (GGDEF)-like protein